MKNLFLFIFFISLTGFSFSQTCAHRQHNGPNRGLQDNLRSDTIDVLNYNVTLTITDFTNKVISGNCKVTFRSKLNGINNLSLDLLAMNIDSIEDELGANLLYSYNDTLVNVILPSTMNDTDTSFVVVYYNGAPVMDPSSWGGFYWSNGYAFNLGVGFESIPHNYGRVWHPCFDNFAEHATYDYSITTNAGKRAYCNGYLVNETINGSDITRVWKLEEPICSYLAGINVANYTHVTQSYLSTVTGLTTPMWLVAVPSDTTNFKNSFIHLPDAMEAFEVGYGPYEWNKVGFSLVPFSSGAMEHATNISYPQAVINGSTTYETLMAHELSHHWWGNLVTCEIAEEMWINEGMAAYSEKWFLEYLYGPTAYFNEVRTNHKNVLWKAHIDDGGFWALADVPLPVTYGTTTYDKGADVVHTMRSYMGDSLFFLGLQTIIANNQFQNISSAGFRDQLNAINGVDVSDFFNDWIFNPGFPQFSIDSTIVIPNGGNFDVTIYVKQKLRGAIDFYTNVPLNVFFRDQNWNLQTRSILVTGETSSFTFTLPFEPIYSALNEDEKISDAITAENVIISSNGLHSIPHANFSITTYSVTDSVFVRVEHNWVAADDFQNANFLIQISPDRYWRVHGIDLDKMYSTGRFIFNGTTTGAGNLDAGLMVDHGSVLFHEDSLVLLYRSSPAQDWSVYPYHQIQTQATETDKVGAVLIDSLKQGDYALGIITSTVGIHTIEENKKLSVFPNPAKDLLTVSYNAALSENMTLEIIDLNGKLISRTAFNSKQAILDVSLLSPAVYIVQLKSGSNTLAAKKIIIE